MKRTYATRFHVLPDSDGANVGETVDRVLDTVDRWVLELAARREVEGFKREDVRGPFDSEQFSVRSTFVRGSKATLFELELSHSDHEDSSKHWTTTIDVSSASGNIEVVIQVHAGYTSLRLIPNEGGGSQPRLVRYLAEEYHCVVDGKRLGSTHSILTKDRVDHFVDNTLLREDRRLPCIVISNDRRGQPSVDPAKLACQVIGMATVYHLDDPGATYALSDRIGNRLSVFDGGIRVYYPRMRVGDSVHVHPLWLWTAIQAAKRAGHMPGQLISQPLYDLMALQLATNKTRAIARKLIAEEKFAKLAQVGDIDSLQKQNEDLRAEIRVLEATIEGLEYQNGALRSQIWENRSEKPPTEQDFLASIGAAEHAGEILDLGERLLANISVHGEAKKRAHGLTSNALDQLGNALYILNEVAYNFDNEGRLGKPLIDAIKDTGTIHSLRYGTVAMRDSDTAVQQFKAERTIEIGGESKTLEAHFTIAKGRPEDVLSMYFEPRPEVGEFIVGIVDRHLTNKGNR